MVTKRTLNSVGTGKERSLAGAHRAAGRVTVAIRVVPLEMQKRIVNKALGMGDMDLLILYCLLLPGLGAAGQSP
jgi:hypothetical protein